MRTALALLAALCLRLPAAGAGLVDSDHADHPAYRDGWQSGDDGSTEPSGFGGWIMGAGAIEPKTTVESSIGLGAGEGTIDRNHRAFRLHDPGGGYVDVFRFLDPLGLEVGETLSFDLAVNYRGGYKGVDARDGDEQTILNFNIGNDDYAVDRASSGNGSLGNTYAADTVFRLAFTQRSGDGGAWTITRGGGVSSTTSGTYAGRIRSLKFYSGGQRDLPEDALYFNGLVISTAP